MRIIKLNTVDSTNNYAFDFLKKEKIDEEIVIFTNEQTKGKGLNKNSWHSEFGKNLLFSVIIFPDIKIEKNFLLSMLVSISVCDYLENKAVFSKIKWPNDIYVGEKKICGILIENVIYGDVIKKSVLGIGININQKSFPDYLPNPVSIINVTGKEYNLDEELNLVSSIVIENFKKIKDYSFEELKIKYLKRLFRYDELSEFKINNRSFYAKIKDILISGHIILETDSGELNKFYFKEVEYII